MSSTYNIEDLGAEAKKRYNEKLEMISQKCCPYLLPGDVWENEPTKWPTLEYPEVYSYLVDSPGIYTKEAMKNRKSLEAHNQFISGWVRTVFHYKIPNTDFIVMKADVLPSQRVSEQPHTPWVAINIASTNVINAHCTCMAGLGESCTHIGALLFKIEAAVRAGFTRRACTEEACQWNNDFKEKVTPAEISKINFYQSSSVENFKKSTHLNWPFPGTNIQPSDDEKEKFLQVLSNQPAKPIVLHSYSNYCQDFIPTYVPPERAKLPKLLRELYTVQNESKSTDEISNISKEFVNNMNISDATVDYVMKLTKKQAQCQTWHDLRTGRITASISNDILHTDLQNPSVSIIKRICQQSKVTKTSIPALKWGIDNESNALFDYQLPHEECSVESVGIKIHRKYPFIGASPDGIFTCRCHNYNRLLEVKCPFSKRETKTIEEAVEDSKFFLDKSLVLKSNHKYYSQVQIQMFVFDFKECDFVVWTPNWMYSQTVYRDEYFIDTSLPVLKFFFENYIVPELLTRRLENSDQTLSSDCTNTEKTFCICNSVYSDDENWIGCDAKDCKWEWFHYTCVNVKRAPKGKWYCPWCRKKPLKRKNLEL